MRKLVLIAFVFMSFTSAQAQKDTTDLKTAITSNFPDNTAGFITPARLRAVAIDLMRSNVNKLEDNVLTGVLSVNDSIKTTDGFYRWTGSDWASVSDDTTAWGRSGGFILPLDYTDKLSIDTGRVEGLLYPTGNVNLGTNSAPFDTVKVNSIVATNLTVEACDSTTVGQVLANMGAGVACWTDPCCPLDAAYDSGGAGAGREIVADNGAVKISGTDGLLVTGEDGTGATIEYVGGGATTAVMYFNPNLGAFRAGLVENDVWDEGNVGEASFSVGNGTKASGTSSISMGDNSESTADQSISIGQGAFSTGDNSISIGLELTSKSYAETVIGLHNTDYTPTSTTTWNATDRLFVIGNGQNSGSRSDALVMLKDGNTGLGTSTPDTTLHVVGQIKYVDGNQGEYKYLTSDANGNASWGQDGCFTGWESITDNTNSWVITAGDTVTIAIHRDVTVNSQLPCGIDSLWNETDSTIIGRNGDALNISLDWTATQNTNTATEFKWWINIGGAVGIIYPTTYDQSKGNGVEKQYNKTTTVYTLDTWETNGGKIQFTADQNMTISNVRINIFRIHKAR